MISREIWADIRTRFRNIRADILVQYAGNQDNTGIEQTVTMLGSAMRAWESAQPVEAIRSTPNDVLNVSRLKLPDGDQNPVQ